MRRMVLVSALMACSVGVAAAGPGGLNLGWDECGGHAASLNRSVACDTNLGTNTLVGSFVTPCCVTAMSGIEVVLNLETLPSWPAWWDTRTGSCRAGAITANTDFTTGPFTCFDYWAGLASSGLLMDGVVGDRARIRILAAVPAGTERPISEGTEVYAFKISISNAKTVGDACPGCVDPVCIVLNSIDIVQPLGNPGGNKFVSAPAARSFAMWRGGLPDCGVRATPVRNETWGMIKALYR